jgi:hypothetical protein
MGVRNCSFPLFVSEDVLQREKDHIEGFAAEVAWVTHAYGYPFASTKDKIETDIFIEDPLPWSERLLSVLLLRPSCTPTIQNGFEATVTFP